MRKSSRRQRTGRRRSDLVATCGNGVVEEGEVCDGAELGGASCESIGAPPGTIGCKANCGGFDVAGCGAPESCGNGSLDEGETCDGAKLGDATCEELGFEEGDLVCLPNCLDFETTSCGAPIDVDPNCEAACGSRECGADPECGTSCGTCGEGTCNAEGFCELPPRTQFDATAMTWSVPNGGMPMAGFDALSGTPGGYEDTVGEQAWSTLDLTGDGLSDLVVTGEAVAREGYDWWGEVLGYGSSPHWDVYENTGSGFAETPTKWSVPSGGGKKGAGFHALADMPRGSDEDTVGEQAWSTIDLTGDGRPDLVVTAEAVPHEAYYWSSEVLGYGSSPHWDVYENTGSGFAETPTKWSVPADGGKKGAGFHALADTPRGSDDDTVGEHAWSTIDLTGDGRPDLVVTAEAMPHESSYWSTEVLGYGSTPHWDVYENTGSGFAATPTKWSVPDGGKNHAGFHALADMPNGSGQDTIGEQAWSTLDLTGDGRPDLVVTGEAVAREGYVWWNEVLGYGSSPHWDVYENTGSGFAATPTKWSVPADGGKKQAGFRAVAGTVRDSDDETIGEQAWSTLDLTGDGRPDLVVTAEAVAREGYYWWSEIFGYDSSPHWRIYVNDGAGFAASSARWSVPTGGKNLAGFNALSGTPGRSDDDPLGEETWSTTDLTGDGVPDLVLTAHAVEREGYSWWSEVFDYETSPHWLVYPAVP